MVNVIRELEEKVLKHVENNGEMIISFENGNTNFQFSMMPEEIQVNENSVYITCTDTSVNLEEITSIKHIEEENDTYGIIGKNGETIYLSLVSDFGNWL